MVAEKNKEAIQLLVDNGFDLTKYGVAPTVVKLGNIENVILGLIDDFKKCKTLLAGT